MNKRIDIPLLFKLLVFELFFEAYKVTKMLKQ